MCLALRPMVHQWAAGAAGEFGEAIASLKSGARAPSSPLGTVTLRLVPTAGTPSKLTVFMVRAASIPTRWRCVATGHSSCSS